MGAVGLNPISYAEIEAWSRLTGQRPTPWEVSVLRRMDSAALKALAPKAQRSGKLERREIMAGDVDALEAALDRMG